ncbi:MAG: hypothetical protein KBA11_05885 [Sedimentibacter sp.]|nr:hypothetical protein [Sedimentibacter sp.]
MIRKMNFGDRERIPVRNENVTGIVLRFILTSSTVNSDPTLANLDLTLMNFEAILSQHGKEVKVLPGIIHPILLAEGFSSPLYKQIWNGTRESVELVTKAAAVKGVQMVTSKIDFGHIINLDGDDELTLNINIPQGVKPADAEAVTSYVEVETIEGIGTQVYVPIYDVYTVRGSENGFKESLGDNVMGIHFINTDKSAVTLANKVLNTAHLRSDRLMTADTYESLAAKRLKEFASLVDANSRNQSFKIFEGTEIDSAIIDCSLNSANVTASKNFFVVKRFVTDSNLTAKAGRMIKKHQRVAFGKLNG